MPGRVRMLGDADTLGLNCLFTGDNFGNVFHVKVGKRCTVAELRAIVCRDGGVRARFPDISIEAIQLWKVYDAPQLLLLPQNIRNRGSPVEGSEPLLHLADIFRDAPPDGCLHVLVQRLQINARSKPQDVADAFRNHSPSGPHHVAWSDQSYVAPIGRPSVLSLSNGPWSGPPAIRSAPAGFALPVQSSPNGSPNSQGTPGGRTYRPSGNEWNAESPAPNAQSFSLLPRSQATVNAAFAAWNQATIRSTASSPGRTGPSPHQDHLERAIFDLVDEDSHDRAFNDSTSPMHSPSPVAHTTTFNRGLIAAYSPHSITSNFQIPVTSSPQSLPTFSANNTPPISPLHSIPSGSASPVHDDVTSSAFLSLWSLPSDITSPASLIAYLRRLKSIARFHLINLFRTRPAGQQVFWLEFASALEATQVRDFLVVKKTSTGELVECPYVSEKAYLEALSMSADTDKWPNPHGLSNLPARAPQPTPPRLPVVTVNARGIPAGARPQGQAVIPPPPPGMFPPPSQQSFQMTLSDVPQRISPPNNNRRNSEQSHDAILKPQKPSFALSSPDKVPPSNSDDRTHGVGAGLSIRTARRATSPSPTSSMSKRLETLPEDPEASESETDEASEPVDLPGPRGHNSLLATHSMPSIASGQGSGFENDDHFGLEGNMRTPTRSHYGPGRKIPRSVTIANISPTSTPSTSASSDDFIRHVGGRR
ncbi:hypothetical protein ONZ45_g8962 [Pleurotus djamor]|nr:hypothetical protein ONZ45_g8962 [Pleurotus djamor]